MSPDSSEIAALPRTIAELPFFVGGRFPKPDLVGQCRADGIVPIGGRELVERVRDIGLGLASVGMAPRDRVAILSESRSEWLLADFAVLASGAVTVPIYPTLSAEQVAFILRDSEASLAVVSTPVQLAKVLSVAATVPALRAVIVIDPPVDPAHGPVPVHTLADIAGRGHRQILDGWGVGRAFHDQAKRVTRDDLATIIYTSGTTGEPKGVMLTHGNLAANLEGITAVVAVGPEDTALSFLPLCHSFEHTVVLVYLANGVSVIFAESIDTVARDIKLVRPTIMTGVPRVFEKLHARILATGREAKGLKRAIFNWAVSVATARGHRLARARGRLSLWLKVVSPLADALVFRRIREGLGGRLRIVVSGSAALASSLGEFFYGVGVPIIEGYGLTETSPVLSVVPLEGVRFGTVGPPLPNVRLRIADDGEVLASGPSVMKGYYKRPAETAAALKDGWFHTGDIGLLDAEGYLRITDRKKELIVTSGGKKIAPQPLEAALRAHPLVHEAVLVGTGRHFPAALIVPDLAALAAKLGVAKPGSLAEAESILGRPDARALISAVVDGVNERLAQFERIKKFALLPREFTMEAGELTPTLKVKRRVIDERYKDTIDGLYRDGI